jgi:hypothetical protein
MQYAISVVFACVVSFVVKAKKKGKSGESKQRGLSGGLRTCPEPGAVCANSGVILVELSEGEFKVEQNVVTIYTMSVKKTARHSPRLYRDGK